MTEKTYDLPDIVAQVRSAGNPPREALGRALGGLAAKAHAALDALPAADRADDRTILTDLARNVISSARLYGVDSELSPSRKKPSQEKHPQT